MIVTLFIQVQARLRFKSGTDPSVRPSLLEQLQKESQERLEREKRQWSALCMIR